jgi:ABC-type transport system involved in multi-copper enzyme maturation permease subunit
MTNLVRAEIRKLTSTRMWLGLTVGGVVLVAFYVTVIAFTAGSTARGGGALASLADPGTVRTVYGVPFEIGFLMPMILGVTLVAGEFRHHTITPTFLATPRRERVVIAKVIVAGGAGLAMGALFTAVAAAIGAIVIAGRGYPVMLGSDGVPRLLVLMVVGLGVWCIFGVGFGALLKNQVAAIVTALALVTIVEGLLTLLLRWVHLAAIAKYLPSNASSAIVAPAGTKASELLPWWGGGLALLGWGLVCAVVGAAVTLRRDVS